MFDLLRALCGLRRGQSDANKIFPADGNPFSVLIVDEDLFARIQLSRLVRRFRPEAEIQLAENGRVAVELCHSRSYFDVIFMALQMPVVNGVEATLHLRAMGVQSMIVGVTSGPVEDEIEAFMVSGLDECFVKPLSQDQVESIIQQLTLW